MRRCLHALTRGAENGGEAWQSLVVDPFMGGVTTAMVAHCERRRFVAGDLNPHPYATSWRAWRETDANPSIASLFEDRGEGSRGDGRLPGCS